MFEWIKYKIDGPTRSFHWSVKRRDFSRTRPAITSESERNMFLTDRNDMQTLLQVK